MATKTRPADPTSEMTSRRPPEPTTAELEQAQAQMTGDVTAVGDVLAKPSFEPPTSAAGAAATAGAGWITNKHVMLLWQTTAARDNWAFIDGGVGWRQGTQTNDVAARGIGLLTAGARAGGGLVYVFEGAGGAIDGIYLW